MLRGDIKELLRDELMEATMAGWMASKKVMDVKSASRRAG